MVLDLVNGRPEMRMAMPTDGRSDVLLSLLVSRGRSWIAPGFGSRLREVKKLHTGTESTMQKHCLDALQWLQDTGRAKTLECTVERDLAARTRLSMRVGVVWANNATAEYEVYQEVV